MTDRGARALAAAVCVQAIKDYEYLCARIANGKLQERNGIMVAGPTFRRWYTSTGRVGGDSLPRYSFAEIETFFINNAEFFVEMNPEIILHYLRRKKLRAKQTAKRHYGS